MFKHQLQGAPADAPSPATLAVLAAATWRSSACAPQEPATTPPSGSSGAGEACSPGDLETLKPDTLTIATDEPAYEPWVVDDDPTNGKGFESAVAYAVAEQLGYAKDEVDWTGCRSTRRSSPGRRTSTSTSTSSRSPRSASRPSTSPRRTTTVTPGRHHHRGLARPTAPRASPT